MRTFESGATRDTDDGKYDYEAFLSPIVLEEFAAYMHEHRVQPDGTLRAGDNWQKGMPIDEYMKSLVRHVIDLWQLHRGYSAVRPEDLHAPSRQESLCAILFNVQGMLHELITSELADAAFTPSDLKRVDL